MAKESECFFCGARCYGGNREDWVVIPHHAGGTIHACVKHPGVKEEHDVYLADQVRGLKGGTTPKHSK